MLLVGHFVRTAGAHACNTIVDFSIVSVVVASVYVCCANLCACVYVFSAVLLLSFVVYSILQNRQAGVSGIAGPFHQHQTSHVSKTNAQLAVCLDASSGLMHAVGQHFVSGLMHAVGHTLRQSR